MMKQFTFIFSLMIAFAACNNEPEADEAETTEPQQVQSAEGSEFIVDTSSTITWIGSKPTGKHEGVFDINEGSLIVNNNNLSGGEFIIDVASISNNDLAGDSANKAKLETHLKSQDFFDVANFPTAKFVITSVEPYLADSTSDIILKGANNIIKGNLTIMDSTKNIAFPAKIMINADSLNAYADFIIDRTSWGMNYKGPNDPHDWFISKDVNIRIDLFARRKR